ncbi:MAG: PAS-domain containing protein [Alphaproteobacteria bacterium]|nr:PAS-domain containing protein [Alphaproteobacteria bacterium]
MAAAISLVVLVVVFLTVVFVGRRRQLHLEARVNAVELALKASMDRLVEAEARLIDAIESVSEGISLFDSDDRLVACNHKYRELHPLVADIAVPGVTFETLIRVGVSRGQYAEVGSRPEEWIAERLKRHGEPPEPFEQRLNDGRVLLVCERRTREGGIVGVRSDITRLKETEQHLLQAQKMEAVGQLTGGIAHDFNNILAVVLANIEFVDEEMDPEDPRRRMLKRALDGVRRGSQLTERLLAFSRRQHLEPVVIQVADVVAGLVEMLRRTIDATIAIETRFDPVPPVKVDRSQLENAVLNLAVNARDAMPHGGTLTIAVSGVVVPAQIDFIKPGNYIVISVSDGGTGMPSHVAERAFEPFYTTKQPGQGSGLGLSMVYGFAKHSGGYAKIDSVEGRGTIVTLYLPAAAGRGVVATDEPDSGTGYPQGHETVLVVEDDAEVRAVAVTTLRKLGYRVHEAWDGISAMECLEKMRPVDLLFSDVVMPGLSGKELAAAARARYASLKVLLTSGYPGARLSDGDLLECDTRLIPKPYTKKQLADTVRAVLDN